MKLLRSLLVVIVVVGWGVSLGPMPVVPAAGVGVTWRITGNRLYMYYPSGILEVFQWDTALGLWIYQYTTSW